MNLDNGIPVATILFFLLFCGFKSFQNKKLRNRFSAKSMWCLCRFMFLLLLLHRFDKILCHSFWIHTNSIESSPAGWLFPKKVLNNFWWLCDVLICTGLFQTSPFVICFCLGWGIRNSCVWFGTWKESSSHSPAHQCVADVECEAAAGFALLCLPLDSFLVSLIPTPRLCV